MASFKSYDATINVADKYAEGHTLTAKEAAALNGLRTELISHRVRASAFNGLKKGETAAGEQVAAAQKKADEISASFEFGAGRVAGEPRVVDPVEKEARAIARGKVQAAIAKAGLKLGKRESTDEAGVTTPQESGEGIYEYTKYLAKVAEVMAMAEVQAEAKKIVALRKSDKGMVAVEL